MWDKIELGNFDADTTRIITNQELTESSRYFECRTAVKISPSCEITKNPKVVCTSSQSHFALAVDNRVSVFYEGCSELICCLNLECPADCLALADDLNLLLIGESNGVMHIFHIPTQAEILSLSVIKRDEADDTAFRGAFFMSDKKGLLKICVLSMYNDIIVFHNIDPAKFSGAIENGDMGEILKTVKKDEFQIASEFTGFLGEHIFDNSVDADYPVGIMGHGVNRFCVRSKCFAPGITLFGHPFREEKFLKACTTGNGRYLLVLDTEHQIMVMCTIMMIAVYAWNKEKVVDFTYTERGDSFSISKRECKIGLLIDSSEENASNKSYSFKIRLFPSFECIYTIAVSENSFISPCKRNQDYMYLIHSETESSDSSELISSVQVKVVSECTPEARLSSLMNKRKFKEAEDFAKVHQLDYQIIYRMKTNYLLEKLSSNSANSNEMDEIICELKSVLSKVEDIAFIKSCLKVSLPILSCARDLLEICRKWLEDHNTDEKEKEILITKINLDLNRMLTHEVLTNTRAFSLQWRNFMSTNLLEYFLHELKRGDPQAAFIVWHRHQGEIMALLNVPLIEDLLYAVPDSLPSSILINFLRDDFLPAVISDIPDAIDIIALWMTKRIEIMEMREKKTWLANGKEFLETFIVVCEKLSKSFVRGRISYTAYLQLHSFHKSSLDSHCAIGGLVELIRQLSELIVLKEKYDCHLSFAHYCLEEKQHVVFFMLDKINVNLLGKAIDEFVRQYANDNAMSLDICLSEYIDDVLRESRCSWWYWEEAPWEKRLLEVVQFIQDMGMWIDTVKAMAFRAPVPWSERIKKLVDRGITVDHPNVESLKEQLRLVGLKEVLIKYDQRSFVINQDMELCRALVDYILKQERSTALEDVIKVYEAYDSRLVKDEAYMSYFYYLLNNEKLADMTDMLGSLPVEISIMCCQCLLSYVTLYLKAKELIEMVDKSKTCTMIEAGVLLTRFLESHDRLPEENLQKSFTSLKKLQKEFDIYASVDDVESKTFCWEVVLQAMDRYFENAGSVEQASHRSCAQDVSVKAIDHSKKSRDRCSVQKIYRLADILRLEREEVMTHLTLRFASHGMYDQAIYLCGELISSYPTEASSKTLVKVIHHFYDQFAEIEKLNFTSFAETILKLVSSAVTYCSNDCLDEFRPMLQHAMLLCTVSRLCFKESPSGLDTVNMSSAYKMWRFSPIYYDDGLWIDADKAKLLMDKSFIDFVNCVCGYNKAPYNSANILYVMDIVKELVTALREKGHDLPSLNITLSTMATVQYFLGKLHQDEAKLLSDSLVDFSTKMQEMAYCVLQKAMDARNPDYPFILGVANIFPLDHMAMLCSDLGAWSYADIHRKITFHAAASEFSAMHNNTERSLVFRKKGEMLLWLSNHVKSASLPVEDVTELDHRGLCNFIKHLITSQGLGLGDIIEFCRIFGLACEDALVIYINHLLLGKEMKQLLTYKVMPENIMNMLLQKAESAIAVFRDKELVLKILKSILQAANSYYYELLMFLHEKIVEISSELQTRIDESYKKGISLLKFLQLYIRVSPPADFETDNWLDENACELPALAQTRLPFHMLMRGNGLKIINNELNATTASVWLQVSSILHLNQDEVIVIAIQNTVSKYVAESKNFGGAAPISVSPNLPLLTSLKELLQRITNRDLSVACASRVTNRLPQGADKVLAAEATALFAKQYASACNEAKVIEMARKMSHVHRQLSIELILQKNNLNCEENLSMLSRPKQLIDHLIENYCVPASQSARVFEVTQQIAGIFNIDLTDIYLAHLCNWLIPVTVRLPLPSDDETFIACGQMDGIESACDIERLNMEKAICFMLGFPNDGMAVMLELLSTKFSNRSLSHRARFLCCLVSVADMNLAESVSGQTYSDLLEHLRHLMCAADMSSLHLPYSTEMFYKCDKLELTEKILSNHARGLKVLTFCIKMCLEFKIWNSKTWLIILQKLSDMLMTEELQGVLASPAGSLAYMWNNRIFIKAWNSLISSLFEKGCDDAENREILKNIYKSLLRCPCAMMLDASSFPEKFQGSGLLTKDAFHEAEQTMSSVITVLSHVILGKIPMKVKIEEPKEEPKQWCPPVVFRRVQPHEIMNYPPMKKSLQANLSFEEESDGECE